MDEELLISSSPLVIGRQLLVVMAPSLFRRVVLRTDRRRTYEHWVMSCS